jgi:hypothetical protein
VGQTYWRLFDIDVAHEIGHQIGGYHTQMEQLAVRKVEIIQSRTRKRILNNGLCWNL